MKLSFYLFGVCLFIVLVFIVGTPLEIVGADSLGQTNSKDSPFGINATSIFHNRDFSRGATTIDFMKKIGARFDRFDFWWHIIEPQKGRFEWSFPDRVVEMYVSNGIEMLPILCYSSAWSGKPPTSDEEVSNYANFVYEVVNRYKDRVKYWQIWNEPNIPTFWNPPDVYWYTKMLKEAYKAAKKADPDCVIIAGNTSGADIRFLQGIYDNGGWDYLDGISFHPYSLAGGPVSQRLDKIISRVVEFVEEKGGDKQIWITEIGWQTAIDLNKYKRNLTGLRIESMRELREEVQMQQARHLFQTYVIALAQGLDKVFWFCAWDFDIPWGLIDGSGTEKLGAKAYQTIVKYLDGSEFKGNINFASHIWAYVYENNGAPVLFLWSEKPDTVRLDFANDGVVVDIFDKVVYDGLSGTCEIEVDGNPIVVCGLGEHYLTNVVSRDVFTKSRNANAVINPSFEEVDEYGGIFGWDVGTVHGTKTDGEFSRTTDAFSGNYAVQLANTTTAAWQTWALAIDDRKTYELSAMINMDEATGKCRIIVTWLGGTGWDVLGSFVSEDIRQTNGWKEFTWTVKPRTGAMFARIELVSIGNSGRVVFDDISLVEVND